MDILAVFFVLVIAYLLGSIPFGLIIVKIRTGKDVRNVGSGRTGGTNAMRAGGFFAGALTGILDFSKAAVAVTVARFVLPGHPWLEVVSALAAVLGHNYSIYLPEKRADGRWHLRGGAGGAPALGGSFGIWYPSFLIIFPFSALVFFLIGYASVTTISVAFFTMLLFAYRAYMGLPGADWAYAIYGLISMVVVLWALRPNLKRLREGNERPVGLRAYFLKKTGKYPLTVKPRQ